MRSTNMSVPKGPQAIMLAHDFAAYYIPIVYIPALIVLCAIALYCRRNFPDIFRRIVVGLGAGVIATLALDVVRQAGVTHGWLPNDTPVMFGKMATASKDFAVYYPVGLLVHYLNGADFGLFFAFVWGKRENYRVAVGWGLFWLMIMELGMMTAPPMGPMVGLFGIDYQWPQLFLLTLVAHIFCGVTLGLLVQHFLRDSERGGLIDHLIGARIHEAT